MLRFTTAGSVDDGKSTLIGRLLHDTKSVYEDQLASIRASRVNRSGGAIDLSLLTDGLRAEREQGITIDVAYRYFSTAKRKFIIADTPGHEQYTRNMATGASTADVAIVLIDAKAFAAAGRPSASVPPPYLYRKSSPHSARGRGGKQDGPASTTRRTSSRRCEHNSLELAQRLKLSSVDLIPISALVGGQRRRSLISDAVVQRPDAPRISRKRSSAHLRSSIRASSVPRATRRPPGRSLPWIRWSSRTRRTPRRSSRPRASEWPNDSCRQHCHLRWRSESSLTLLRASR